MMRRDFAGHPRPAALSAPHGLQRIGGRKMRHMQARIRNLLRKLDIAVHNARFRRRLPAAQAQPERRSAHRSSDSFPSAACLRRAAPPGKLSSPLSRRHSRMMSLSRIGRPSSVTATAPARCKPRKSVSTAPLLAWVAAAHGKDIDHRAAFRLAQPVHPLLRVDRSASYSACSTPR